MNYEHRLAGINKLLVFPRKLAKCEVTEHSEALHPLTFLKTSDESGIVSLHYATDLHTAVPENGRNKCLLKTGKLEGWTACYAVSQSKAYRSQALDLVYLITPCQPQRFV
jgi:hypothetical protein